jgi:transposase
MTYGEFLRMFPSNQACLDYLRDKFYAAGSECPFCHKGTKFHHVKGRSAYACQYCRGQVYPTAGTIFHKSTTSLQMWFYAIYLMSSTRCGISAKQLEREVGVTYKTAHRMFKQIRSMLDQDDDQLSGDVEMDETFVGGKPRLADRERKADGTFKRGKTAHTKRKPMVFGAVERGGRIRAEVVSQDERGGIARRVDEFVMPSSVIYTDEYVAYDKPGQVFADHRRIRHEARVYVDGDVHTQTIEGFWALLKGGLTGVYHGVSTEYLQAYVDEFTFRYNHREDERPMFWTFLDRVTKALPAPAQ